MTKKNIWAKLLIVALIVAMVSAFFIGCDKTGKDNDKEDPKDPVCTEHVDNDGDGLCDICGEVVEEVVDTTAVEALLKVVDDAVAELAKIENVGNLGTDAFVEVKVNDTTVRIDLDLSLDLLNEATGGTGYANNGFGFTVTVNGTQEFGLWYVNGEDENYQYVYLKTKDQNLKISALTLSKILERYNVNANVPTNGTLDISVLDKASSYIAMIASMVKIDYTESNGNKTFSLNVKELFNPEGDLIGVVDALLFGEEAAIGVDLGGILKDQNINITSTAALYEILPDISLKVTGNYSDNKFQSIGLGLDITGQEISIPVITGDPIKIEAFPDTDISATLGFQVLTNDAAFTNVDNALVEVIDANQWNQIGVLNVAFEAQVKLGKDAETAKTYDITLSADVDLSKVADATFTKRVYYVNDAGEYYEENGAIKYTDWFYLSGAGIFKSDRDADVIDALLPAVNSLFIKMENVADSSDVLLINLNEAITKDEKGDWATGGVAIKLGALTSLLDTFGVKLDSSISGMISSLENENLGAKSLLNLVKPVLAGFIYKGMPDNYSPTTVAPASATGLALAEGETTEKPSVIDTIMEVVDKIKNCVTIDTKNGTITAAGSGPDYVIGGANVTFDMTASLIKDDTADKDKVTGVKVVFNKALDLDYNAEIKDTDGKTVIGTDKVHTVINVPFVQIGGAGNLFKAAVSVTQDKEKTYTKPDADHENESSEFSIYVEFDLKTIGYGCASTSPVKLDSNYDPTAPLFSDTVGWKVSK